MAIGTNGIAIATRSDCNSLCSYSSYKFTTDLYKCVTVEEANGGVSPVCTKTLDYSDTSKCVKYAQLDPRYIKCGVSGPITISVKIVLSISPSIQRKSKRALPETVLTIVSSILLNFL